MQLHGQSDAAAQHWVQAGRMAVSLPLAQHKVGCPGPGQPFHGIVTPIRPTMCADELRSQSAASEDEEEDGAGEDPVLFWRKEGEAWEPPADEDTAGTDANADETYCLHDVLDR